MTAIATREAGHPRDGVRGVRRGLARTPEPAPGALALRFLTAALIPALLSADLNIGHQMNTGMIASFALAPIWFPYFVKVPAGGVFPMTTTTTSSSGGGTPALLTLGDFPMMTEHRAGTYVYNDVMMVSSGVADWDDCAMHVRATVVSVPTENRAIIDAGSKVLTREQYYVKDFGRIVEYPDAVVSNASEEHGMIDISRSAAKPKVGEVISIIPNHCCVVSNMVDEVYGVRNGSVEVVWPVAARGRVR